MTIQLQKFRVAIVEREGGICVSFVSFQFLIYKVAIFNILCSLSIGLLGSVKFSSFSLNPMRNRECVNFKLQILAPHTTSDYIIIGIEHLAFVYSFYVYQN